MAAQEAESGPPPEHVVLEECAEVVGLFIALGTQWRRAGYRGRMAGLDYPAARATAEWLGMTITPGLLLDLRTMETAALAVLWRD